MRKSRISTQVNWGRYTTGDYYYTVSGGAKTTWCHWLKLCTAEASEQAYAFGQSSTDRSLTSNTEFLEWIEDDDRVFRPSGQLNYKSCNHYREGQAKNLPFGGVLLTSSGGGYLYKFYREPFPQTTVTSVNAHLTEELSAAQSRAWYAMQPEFTGNVSMLNFLFELTEVKSLVGDLYKAISALRSALRRPIRPKLSDPSKPASESYLQYQFGVKPLVADLVQIGHQLLETVKDAQEKFALEGLSGLTRHYSETLAETNSCTHEYGIGSGTQVKTVFTATMEYRYKYQLRPPLEAMKQYWGLNLSAEAIWNALPFSFLVDYFIQVGKAISWMETDPNVCLQLGLYGESLKTSSSAGKYIRLGPSQDWPIVINDQLVSFGTHLVSGTETSLYTRYLSLPNKGMAVPRVRKPTDRQQMNMAALLRCLL